MVGIQNVSKNSNSKPKSMCRKQMAVMCTKTPQVKSVNAVDSIIVSTLICRHAHFRSRSFFGGFGGEVKTSRQLGLGGGRYRTAIQNFE